MKTDPIDFPPDHPSRSRPPRADTSGNLALRVDHGAWPEELAPELEIAGPDVVEQRPPTDELRLARAAWIRQCVQVVALAAYVGVVAVGIAWHEPWADEGQAWLLARDQGFWHLMLHALHYEGTPGLWHALLWALTRAHVGYTGMRWVSGVIAAVGAYVLLRWSPFPLILRVLLPLGFWLAYQDAVVARGYVVFAMLAFPAAAILRRMSANYAPARKGRMIWLALLLGLMANLCVYGFVASVGFAVVALAILRRKARAGLPARTTKPVVLLCCLWILAAATALPSSDVDFPAGRNLQRSTQKIWAALGSRTARAELQAESAASLAPRYAGQSLLTAHPSPKAPGEPRWHKSYRILALLTFPISNFRWLALAACGLVIAQAIVYGPRFGQLGWIGLMPWALMIVIFSSIYLEPHHAGMLWESLIASLWLTWPDEWIVGGRADWLQRITLAALVLVALNQVQWTAHSLLEEIRKPYAGDEAMAKWLKSSQAGKRIAGFGFYSVGVAAWFDHPIFFNQPTAYWIWSRQPRIDALAPITLAQHPDVIVVGGVNWNTHNSDIRDDWIRPDPTQLNLDPLNDPLHVVDYAEARGYRETHRFCGHASMRSGYAEELCQVALQPVQ
jgi:hypothetical protein